MQNNAAYNVISNTHNMLTEDNIAYYRQTMTQIPTEDCIAYGQIGDQIPTEDNTAYNISTQCHLEVPIATNDNPAHVINGNISTSDQNADCQDNVYDYIDQLQ